jgi:ATP-dependent exoDNAse (exonuclease V) beta subunit
MYHSHEEKKRVLFVGEMGKDEKKQYEAEEEGDAERLMYVAMTRAKALCFVQVDAIGKPESRKRKTSKSLFSEGFHPRCLGGWQK